MFLIYNFSWIETFSQNYKQYWLAMWKIFFNWSAYGIFFRLDMLATIILESEIPDKNLLTYLRHSAYI